MSYGKSVRLYLPDNDVCGIRHAEVANWNGQAMAVPRSRCDELELWDEVSGPGLFVLVGGSNNGREGRTFIGASEDVFESLANHDPADSGFWRECVIITSKDDNLTRARLMYLKSRLIDMSIKAARYYVEGTDSSEAPSLTRQDADMMEEFIEYIRILLGTLGHPVTEPKPKDESNPFNSSPSSSAKSSAYSSRGFESRNRVEDKDEDETDVVKMEGDAGNGEEGAAASDESSEKSDDETGALGF